MRDIKYKIQYVTSDRPRGREEKMPTANEYKRLRAKCESIRWSTGNKDVRKVSMDIGHIPSTREKKKACLL